MEQNELAYRSYSEKIDKKIKKTRQIRINPLLQLHAAQKEVKKKRNLAMRYSRHDFAESWDISPLSIRTKTSITQTSFSFFSFTSHSHV